VLEKRLSKKQDVLSEKRTRISNDVIDFQFCFKLVEVRKK